jgi:hypothetical protein
MRMTAFYVMCDLVSFGSSCGFGLVPTDRETAVTSEGKQPALAVANRHRHSVSKVLASSCNIYMISF